MLNPFKRSWVDDTPLFLCGCVVALVLAFVCLGAASAHFFGDAFVRLAAATSASATAAIVVWSWLRHIRRKRWDARIDRYAADDTAGDA